ncbi:hypothetical protein [Succinivibrio dextrinosolvens]|jgi:hypothetical protein|uniref:hypothetical protein n=1 Tax=Succinivibrio dextrinosolvens TaxID=83771 RepID=UPI00241F24A8|nr:hypothetical protein [Succinivibrio dextrinosolvens]
MEATESSSREDLAEEILEYYFDNEDEFDGKLLSTIIEKCKANVSEEYREKYL